MQGPTPPTKPTPPTPPSMKTSSGATSTDTHNQATTTTQPTNSSKDVPKVSATEQSQSTSTPAESKNNIPPLGSYSNANSNAKETASETTMAPIMPVQKNNPVSSSITIFLAIASFIIVGTAVVLWFKNNKPKQKSTINYSTESTDDIVNLILSQAPPESASQVAPKPLPKKLLLKPAPKPKNKGGFEVRI